MKIQPLQTNSTLLKWKYIKKFIVESVEPKVEIISSPENLEVNDNENDNGIQN